MEFNNQYFKHQTLFWKLFEKLSTETISNAQPAHHESMEFVLPNKLIPLDLQHGEAEKALSELTSK